ncbi:MAG: hypothetical protein ACREAF_03435 [Nitrosopumilaceae archaeon]
MPNGKKEQGWKGVEGRTVIAVILIAPVFIIFGVILVMHWGYVSQILTLTEELMDNSNQTIQAKQEFLEKMTNTVDRTNQNIYNILIPVFAAWVGAVVAFYFGSRQAQEAQQAQEKVIKEVKAAQGPSDNLSKITVGELIQKYPVLKDFKKFTINATINLEFEKALEDYGEVLIQFEVPTTDVVRNQLPKWNTAGGGEAFYKKYEGNSLGVLYIGDVYALENYSDYKNKTIGEMIVKTNAETELGRVLLDKIVTKKWTIDPEEGMANFAEVSMTETTREAKAKLEDVSDNAYDARALVLEKGEVIAMISNRDLLLDI